MNASSIHLAIGLVVFTASRAFAVSYSDYAGAAIRESGVVNTNRSTGLNPATAASTDIGILNKPQFAQVSQAIAEIAQQPSFKAEADRLADWLGGGYILTDRTLGSGTSGETRRDGSSKPFMAPDWGPVGSDKICLDGNIYLNASKEFLFFPPRELEKKKAFAVVLVAKKKSGKRFTDAQRTSLADLLQQMDSRFSSIFLQSILVHEVTHTQQRPFANEKTAYARQLDYLKALLPAASREDAARLKVLIKQVEVDRGEQAK